MSRLALVFLLFCVADFSQEDFFTDIDQTSKVGVVRENLKNPRPVFKTVEQEILYDHLGETITRVREQKILNLSQKISKLDDAATLPVSLKKEYRERQKSLDRLRHRLADRHVDSLLNVPYKTLEGRQEHDVRRVVAEQAQQALAKVSEENVETFLDSWKVSLVDGGARQTFVTYVAFVNLYGPDHPLSKGQLDFLETYRNSFKEQLKEAGPIPKEESADLAYEVLRKHVSMLSRPLRSRFQKIQLLEESLGEASDDLRETGLILRKMDFQKQILLELLQKEGLKISADFDPDELEKALFDWLSSSIDEQRRLGWPLLERGVVVYGFEAQANPLVRLKAQKTNDLLALCKGKISVVSKEFIGLKCSPYIIRLEGDFSPVVKDGQEVEKGQILAAFREVNLFNVTILNSDEGGIAVDLLSFF
ncbi:hypothetical protein HOF92_04085 [bacterium]|jgi:hypothetical protein|nr:hypothetical protein [bacterium]